jgi:prepilin-type N-terminal cleavage/methylation domain-containing protein
LAMLIPHIEATIDLFIRKTYKLPGNNNAGYTMVELLAALTILSIGLLGIFSAISAARDTQQRAVYMAIARNTAITYMETFRSLKSDKLNTVPASGTLTTLPAGNSFTCTTSKNVDKLYLATVTVTWPEGLGTRSIKYETLFYKP